MKDVSIVLTLFLYIVARILIITVTNSGTEFNHVMIDSIKFSGRLTGVQSTLELWIILNE